MKNDVSKFKMILYPVLGIIFGGIIGILIEVIIIFFQLFYSGTTILFAFHPVFLQSYIPPFILGCIIGGFIEKRIFYKQSYKYFIISGLILLLIYNFLLFIFL